MIPMLFTLSVRKVPASFSFCGGFHFSKSWCIYLFLASLYCTFTNENRPALLELIFLAYLFRQLLPVRSSCLESSAQEGFFRESGRKGRLANDRSEFHHWTISSSCVHVNLFSCVCVFACFFFFFFKLPLPLWSSIGGFVSCDMKRGGFIFRSLHWKELAEQYARSAGIRR